MGKFNSTTRNWWCTVYTLMHQKKSYFTLIWMAVNSLCYKTEVYSFCRFFRSFSVFRVFFGRWKIPYLPNRQSEFLVRNPKSEQNRPKIVRSRANFCIFFGEFQSLISIGARDIFFGPNDNFFLILWTPNHFKSHNKSANFSNIKCQALEEMIYFTNN